MGFVIIPFDYEQLPDAQQKWIVPIRIPSVDRYGNPIARIWFEQGVAPVQEQLRDHVIHCAPCYQEYLGLRESCRLSHDDKALRESR